jgi:hypothetical protein
VTPKAQTITSNQQSTSSVGFRQDDRDHDLKSTSNGFSRARRNFAGKTKNPNFFFSEVAPQWQQAQKTGGAQ